MILHVEISCFLKNSGDGDGVNGKLLFKEHKISVWEDEKVLELDNVMIAEY